MKKQAVVLKWRNKFSGEEGYVRSVRPSYDMFINTFNKGEAKIYPCEGSAQYVKDLNTLERIGETVNNIFFAEAWEQ